MSGPGEGHLTKRPRRVLGVTGRRDLDPENLLRLRLELSDKLDAIIREAGGPEELLMLNALAMGADALMFDLAREKSIPVAAVLPLPAEDYSLDFPQGPDRDAFCRRLAQSRYVWAPDIALPRPECYDLLGETLVRHADTLIALWDGKPDRGPGGTAAVLERARAKTTRDCGGKGWILPLPFAGITRVVQVLAPCGTGTQTNRTEAAETKER